ncbi:hypothetical protein Y032_0003g1567 [Ancylostoma ceylanicum]|uniref:Uncharacterized protein n=1 Tax=Ancylostoma ceylanicum TaxID=53326 RepID=A0A016VYE1_9BILA|nr:hypothetical protein Y032_0003g1567 [Ancylostoma ceylanicum]
MLYKGEVGKTMYPLLSMASARIVFVFFYFLSVSAALKCYLGECSSRWKYYFGITYRYYITNCCKNFLW